MTHYRKCGQCLKDKPLDGGCEVKPTRWLCVVCWRKLMRVRFAA